MNFIKVFATVSTNLSQKSESYTNGKIAEKSVSISIIDSGSAVSIIFAKFEKSINLKEKLTVLRGKFFVANGFSFQILGSNYLKVQFD